MFASFSGACQSHSAIAASRRSPAGLRRDKSGNVAMMFALLVIPLTGAIGLAVDMGRVYHVAMHTQGALDAAALAAGRVAQVEKTDTLNKASKSASAYFDQAKPTDVVQTSIVFAPNTQQTEFTVTATSWVRTPFLSVLKLIAPGSAGSDAPPGCKDSYLRLRQGRLNRHGADLPQLQRRRRRQRRRRHQSRDLDDARRHGLDGRRQDHRPASRGQGPDRHRGLGRPEQVHLEGGAGAVRAGGQRRRTTSPRSRASPTARTTTAAQEEHPLPSALLQATAR